MKGSVGTLLSASNSLKSIITSLILCQILQMETEILSVSNKEANGILSCIGGAWQQVERGGPLPLLSTGETYLVLYTAPGSQYKRDIDILEQVQQRAIKLIKGLEHLYGSGTVKL